METDEFCFTYIYVLRIFASPVDGMLKCLVSRSMWYNEYSYTVAHFVKLFSNTFLSKYHIWESAMIQMLRNCNCITKYKLCYINGASFLS